MFERDDRARRRRSRARDRDPHAAVTTAILAPLKAGDHVVAARRCSLLPAMSWKIAALTAFPSPRWSTGSTSTSGGRRCGRNTKTCFLESPTNPTLDVLDIQAIAEIALRAARG